LAKDIVCKFGSLCAIGHLFLTNPGPGQADSALAEDFHPVRRETASSALRFVKGTQVVPASFATGSFFPNDTFIFVNKAGVKQAGRYQIIPFAGQHDLNDEEARAKSEGFLFDDLKTRLATGPIKYHLIVQLPNPGDPTKDPSILWPYDRKTIDMGTISITSVVADSSAAEKELAFDPTNLTDGIELSDDPFPSLRSRVYALAVLHRQ
jgi:catalase